MVKQRKGVKEDLIVPIKNAEPKSNTPTPEQMRIAQILEKKVVDSTIKLKLKQIMDATQRSADEVYVALHDSDFDVNRAVNLLIEGENQLADWCTNEKRKKKLAELKDKKEEVVEVEVPQPEKKNIVRGRGDDKRRPGRRQDGDRRPQKTQDEHRKQANSEPRAPRSKRPGFGSMVFERSNPPPIDTGFLPPVRNQWEKPLLKSNGPEDDWDCEEFQGSLSQTQIFTSSKKPEPQETSEELKMPKVISPSPVPPLSSLTFTNKTHDPRDQGSFPQKRDPGTDVRPNVIPLQEKSMVIPSQERTPVIPKEERSTIVPSQERAIIPSQDRPVIISSQDRPNEVSSQDRSLTSETRTDYVYRMNYAKTNHHDDKRPPSKIPTLPVEMPPELKPSLSFLDIQFGAMDLCQSETSNESQSNTPSQNTSATTLMAPSSLPSSCSVTHLMGNAIISSSSTNNMLSSVTNVSANSPLTSTTSTNSPGISSVTNNPEVNSISSPPGLNGITSLPGISSATSPPGLISITNSIPNSGISSSNNTTLSTVVNQSLNSIANSALNSIVSANSLASANMSSSNSISSMNLVPPNSLSGNVGHLMEQSNLQQPGANMAPSSIPNASHNMVPNHNYVTANTQSRFMPSSQAFNSSHLQYGIINPPVTTHGYESRESAPPPHPHAHLPPFKSPPGVPKSAMVPNLPPGSLVGNQYIVGQGNVPYFPHPPIYYYEEVPPVMNSQQRLTSMASHPHHFDVSYQTAPSSRDSVHYNV